MMSQKEDDYACACTMVRSGTLFPVAATQQSSSEKQGLVTLVAAVLKPAILALLRWAVFVLTDYQCSPRGKDELWAFTQYLSLN